MHVTELGGSIKSATFDPTQQQTFKTGEILPKKGISEEEEARYDPTKVTEMIEFIKKQRESQLEGRIANRELKVINSLNNGANLKQLLFDID